MVRKLELKQIAINSQRFVLRPPTSNSHTVMFKNDEKNLATKAEITVLSGGRYHRNRHREWMRDDF